MPQDEDRSASLSSSTTPTDRTGRLASRRWATVMLVLGLVLGVLAGQIIALYRPHLLAWMVDPAGPPVVAPAPLTDPEASPQGPSYGSGLSNPATAASRGLSAAELRLISRINDLSEQIEALPTQFAQPALAPQAPSGQPAGWMEGLAQTLSRLFLVRKLSDSERFQLDATGYELAKRQIEQRLLAARLSVQMGERELAQIDLSQATLLMARTLDPRDPEVLRVVAETQAISDALERQP